MQDYNRYPSLLGGSNTVLTDTSRSQVNVSLPRGATARQTEIQTARPGQQTFTPATSQSPPEPPRILISPPESDTNLEVALDANIKLESEVNSSKRTMPSTTDTPPAASKEKSTSSPQDKELPPKPVLRPLYSPERGITVYDAADSASRRLDSRFPPLAPARSMIPSPYKSRSSPESPDSRDGIAHSSSASSFFVTPSLRTNSARSTPSEKTPSVEYGVAASTSIRSFRAADIAIDVRERRNSRDLESQATMASFGSTNLPSPLSRYNSKNPGISQARHHSTGHIALQKSGTVSRIPRPTSSNTFTNSPITPRSSSPRTPNTDSATTGQKNTSSTAFSPGAETPVPSKNSRFTVRDVHGDASHMKNRSQPHESEQKIFQRTSKYGYKIREHQEAREVIMGNSQKSKSTSQSKILERAHKTDSPKLNINPMFNSGGIEPHTTILKEEEKASKDNQGIRGPSTLSRALLESDLSIPKLRRARKHIEFSRERETREKARKVYRAAGVRPPISRYKPLPRRTSSLPSSPSSISILEEGKETVDSTDHRNGLDNNCSNFTPSLSMTQEKLNFPRVHDEKSSQSSILASTAVEPFPITRSTTDNPSRHSIISLNIRRSTDSDSWIKVSGVQGQRAHTLTSIGNVGKGIKNWGKKVGKIVHSRHLSNPEASKDGLMRDAHDVLPLSRHIDRGETKCSSDHGNSKAPAGDKTSSPNIPLGSSGVSVLDNNTINNPVADATLDVIIQDAEARYRKLLDLAAESDEPLRDILITAAEHLAGGLVAIREARISALRLEQSVDRVLLMMTRSRNDIVINATAPN